MNAGIAGNKHNASQSNNDCCPYCENSSARRSILPARLLLATRRFCPDENQAQLTVILSSAVVTVPTSSVQVNLHVPLSSILA
jgi:hypothetical protein